MLKTAVLLNIFKETVIHFLTIVWRIGSKKKQAVFQIAIFCNIINVLNKKLIIKKTYWSYIFGGVDSINLKIYYYLFIPVCLLCIK